MRAVLTLAALALLALVPAAAAQDAPPDTTAAPAEAAAAPAAATAAPAVTPAPAPARASWLGDRRALAVGDLLTIVVDEQTVAREKVTNTAVGDRTQRAGLNTGGVSPLNIIGPAKEFSTGLTNQSRNDGDVSRSGNLSAMLTVRVTGFEPGGAARVEGSKTVTVDGRTQQMSLKGVVRPQDVLGQNRVLSSSVADAVITYKGKKIAPKSGLLGGILNMLWP